MGRFIKIEKIVNRRDWDLRGEGHKTGTPGKQRVITIKRVAQMVRKDGN
jgi:hypothetical protein